MFLLTWNPLQSEDLFSTEASDGELNKLRKDLEESRGSNVDINKYQATTIASLLVEFFSQLPVPLSAHLSGAFCNALSHEKAALQIAELKALLRQLPDVHRNVLTYMLRFMIEVSTHEHANSASRQTLAEAFATKMFRQHQTDEGEDDEEWDEDDRSPRDKQKLLLLMLSHQPELEGASVRGRATRAGVIPEGTLTVGFSPALSSVQSGGTSTSVSVVPLRVKLLVNLRCCSRLLAGALFRAKRPHLDFGVSSNASSKASSKPALLQVGLSTSGTGTSPDKNAKSPQSSGSVVAMRSTAGVSAEAGPHVLEQQLPMLLDEGTAAGTLFTCFTSKKIAQTCKYWQLRSCVQCGSTQTAPRRSHCCAQFNFFTRTNEQTLTLAEELFFVLVNWQCGSSQTATKRSHCWCSSCSRSWAPGYSPDYLLY
jgi:hypothetical protein